jgi:uncharacterized membrane protein
MRTDDFRFYGQLCRIIGIVLIVIGVILPILTAQYITYLYNILPPEWRFPYLIHGIALVTIGIVFIILSVVLYREYGWRLKETRIPPPPPPSEKK